VLQGFLYVGAPQPKTFNEDQKQLMSVIAVATAHAVRALSLAQEIRTGWMTDTTTGVFTHRYFRARLSDELALCRRTGDPLWLAVLDLDRFSTFNSEHGHRDGDRMLRKVADLLSGELPTDGILARYGGDEFALAVRGQDKAAGTAFAERLRLLCKDALDPLTVSLGVAAAPDDGMRALELLQAAEEALFASKAGGRDRVGPPLT
jgi:diguanylate cyclase (GGDEF)-like protein